MLIYGIQSGQIQVPTQALWKPEVAGSPYAAPNFQRGIFSPFLLQVPRNYPANGAFMDMVLRGGAGNLNATSAHNAATAQGVPGAGFVAGSRQPFNNLS